MMDTPPQPPEKHWDAKGHPITVMCQECGGLIEVKDIHAYLLAVHLGVCQEMTLLNGEHE